MAADTHAEGRAGERVERNGVEALVRPEPADVEHAPVGNLALWLGVLTGPSVFMILLEFNYVLEEWACRVGSYWPLHVPPAVATLVTVGALVLAWRNWVASGRVWPEDHGGARARGGR